MLSEKEMDQAGIALLLIGIACAAALAVSLTTYWIHNLLQGIFW